MVNNFEDMFIRFDTIHERDGQTDRPAGPRPWTVFLLDFATSAFLSDNSVVRKDAFV